jgi:SAM-dependent methyltransferase
MRRPLYRQLVSYYELIEGRDWKSEVGLITSILRDHGSKSLVDLGCGTGYHVRALTKLDFEATGIDISKENIRFARRKAAEEKIHPRFVVGSYYDYHHPAKFDAALCLNWSIPVRNDEVKRFLDNTYALLRPKGLLIFDYERVSQIVWSDVGKAIVQSWDQKNQLIVRVSLGQVASNVLYSRDVYIIYPSLHKLIVPGERSRYQADKRTSHVQVYIDSSCVRFFSVSEIRDFARKSGFRVISNFVLPRNDYKRNYVVLERVN